MVCGDVNVCENVGGHRSERVHARRLEAPCRAHSLAKKGEGEEWREGGREGEGERENDYQLLGIQTDA